MLKKNCVCHFNYEKLMQKLFSIKKNNASLHTA